jgi:hypothetical protein
LVLLADARGRWRGRSPFDALATLACSGQALGPLVKTRALRDDTLLSCDF